MFKRIPDIKNYIVHPKRTEVGICRRNAPNLTIKGGCMADRFTHLLKSYSKEQEKYKKDKTLFSARKEVEINGNGTTGYVIKEGSNKNKVLQHISVKSKNNW